MADTQTNTDSVSDKPLASVINQIPGALSQSQGNRQSIEQKAADLPNVLGTIREKENKEIAALGDAPQLTPEEMRHYLGKPPPEQGTSLGQEWGSPAMAIAMIGSLFTQTPFTSALNAGAKVMNAYQEGDFAAAKQHYDEWKEANDTGLKLYGIQADAYKNALARIRSDSADERKDAVAELQALSSAFRDNNLRDLIAAGRLDEAEQLVGTRNSAADKMRLATERAQKEHDLAQSIHDKREALRDAQAAGDPDAIAAAQKELDGAMQDAQDYRAAFSGTGGKKGESTAESRRNEQITEARSTIESLGKGETVEYGGYEITPDDFNSQASGAVAPGFTPTDKQKAIATMRKMAGTPTSENGVAQPVPHLHEQPAGTPAAAGQPTTTATAAQPPKADPKLVAQARDAITKGVARDAVKKVFIQQGGTAEQFDTEFPEGTPVVPAGM